MSRDQRHHNSDDRTGPAVLTGWRLVCLLLLASAWGLSELIGGATAHLTGVALLLLAVARTLVNRPGSSTALAAVAVLFKSVNVAPFVCHLAGIALLGIAFDLVASLLWREDRRPFLRAACTGTISAALSSFFFAASMVWVFAWDRWAGGGFERVAEYVLISGSRGAITGLFVVPVGLWSGRLLMRYAAERPRAVLAATGAVCLALWVLGPVAG